MDLPVVRRVSSAAELALAFEVAGAQFDPAFTSADDRFLDLRRRWPEDRPLMVVAHDRGGVVGSALGFRAGNGLAVLRTIGLDPAIRRQGLGRRFVETLVMEAMALGCQTVVAGGLEAGTKGFYERLGFHGRGSTMRRDLPPPGRIRELHVQRLRAIIGRDLGATMP